MARSIIGAFAVFPVPVFLDCLWYHATDPLFKCIVYKQFVNMIMNFATNFGAKFATFRERLYGINCKSIILILHDFILLFPKCCKVHNFIHKLVNNAFVEWLFLVQGPIKGFVYNPACEFQYEPLNFTTKLGTKFATLREKLCEIDCITNQIHLF
jgi:hypothetical protein